MPFEDSTNTLNKWQGLTLTRLAGIRSDLKYYYTGSQVRHFHGGKVRLSTISKHWSHKTIMHLEVFGKTAQSVCSKLVAKAIFAPKSVKILKDTESCAAKQRGHQEMFYTSEQYGNIRSLAFEKPGPLLP